MASPGLTELVTTTLLNRSRKIADNVTKNNAVLTKLKAKGKVMPFSGGREIVHELSYAENQTFKYYSGYEILNISPSDVLSAAVYQIKQAATAVAMSGLEELQNSGKEQMLDLLASRIDVAESTMKNRLSNDIYSDGTGSGGKQITGLQNQVDTTPATGITGKINRANKRVLEKPGRSRSNQRHTKRHQAGSPVQRYAVVVDEDDQGQRQGRPDNG